MPDAKIEEEASLYVLDLLAPAEKREFERLQRESPTVRATVRDLQVNLDALAQAAPPLSAPPGAWERIRVQIESDSWVGRPGHVRWLWLGWPLAACLAVGWLLSALYLAHLGGPPPEATRSAPQSLAKRERPGAMPGREATASETVSQVQRLESALNQQKQELKRLGTELNREQEKNRVQTSRLGQLSNSAAGMERRLLLYAAAQPGLKRLVVVNLRDPRAVMPVPDVLPDAGKVIANEAAKRFNAPTETPSASPSVTTPAARSTSPPTPGSAAAVGVAPTVANATSPVSQGNPPAASASDTAPRGTETTHPPTPEGQGATTTPGFGTNAIGVVVYDQATQSGSVILQGLANLTPGTAYQLWALDPQYSQPVNVGLLPNPSNGFSQINFTLPLLNFNPTRFLVTLEPAAGSVQPTGPVILDGPSP